MSSAAIGLKFGSSTCSFRSGEKAIASIPWRIALGLLLLVSSFLNAQDFVGLAQAGRWSPSDPDISGATIRDVQVEGDLAYVAFGTGGRYPVDVSDAGAPRQVGHCTVAGTAVEVRVAGGYAYLAAGTGGLQIVDVSSPSSPASPEVISGGITVRLAVSMSAANSRWCAPTIGCC